MTDISTFYSYKGGVGRTLLMANTGVALAQTGCKTLLWDLDLEAPGLHHIPALTPQPMPTTGFLEWLLAWRKSGAPTAAKIDHLAACICPAPGIDGLFILPAHGSDADYADLYQQIDWHAFMVAKPSKGVALYQAILKHLSTQQAFDHILLDARTGITDLGGVMAALLPHTTVLVGNYSAQSTKGLANIYQSLQTAADGRLRYREQGNLPKLNRILVASPVPKDRKQHHDRQIQTWKQYFPNHQAIEVPFDPDLLFQEKLAIIETPDSTTAQAYRQVAEQLQQHAMALAQTRRKNTAARYGDKTPFDDDRKEKGDAFEQLVARLLRLQGYRVENEQVIDGSKVDRIAYLQAGFEEICYFVECKNHAAPIDKATLEKLYGWTQGVQARSMGAKAMLVANGYAPHALTYAKSHGMLALTVEDLERKLIDLTVYHHRLRQRFEATRLARTYVAQQVLLEAAPKKTGDALPAYAKQWAAGAQGRQLWLLLGDYGTGKTAFFHYFSHQLAVAAEKDRDAVLPIAINLKEFPNAITLEGLLQEHLREYAQWTGNPDVLLYMLEAGRIILLLDAFDEMGTAAVGRSIEEQFRELARAATRGVGRVLITCRTHFFRDQQQIKAEYLTNDDDLISHDSPLGKVARDFEASMDELMLFNPAQIDQFLTNHLPTNQIVAAQDFIRDTYNLPNLAPRPVMLEMIIQSLPKLMQAVPGAITPAGLYQTYTDDWLKDFSGGNLQTSVNQRRRILEYLAFALWGLPQHHIHHLKLLAVLEECQHLFAGLDLARVDLELRTAAFLTRTQDGYFSFSHKSFREFFYARFILRQIQENSLKAMRMALNTVELTLECVQFLADLTGAADAALCKALLPELLTTYQPQASENSLRLVYWLAQLGPTWLRGETLHTRMQTLMPEQAVLTGAHLRGVDLSGAWLVNADFTQADLRGANLRGVVADRAKFTQADLQQCNAMQGHFDQSDFSQADLREMDASECRLHDALFRATRLQDAKLTRANAVGADFSSAQCERARFALADLTQAQWTNAQCQGMTAPGAIGLQTMGLPTRLQALWQTGHLGWVWSVAFAPDGKTLLSAGENGELLLWDATNGECLRAFEGHQGSVWSVAFAPDGKTLLSGGGDSKVMLWETTNGERLRTFEGHQGSVWSVAFAPDGKTLLSGGGDGQLLLWETINGECLRTFEGHTDWIKSVAFAPDGKTLLSGGDDNKVMLWETINGECLRTFEGHTDWIKSVAFAPDGKTLLSGGDDNKVMLWETSNGERLRTFEGHQGIVLSVAFAPDGKTLLSGGSDHKVMLWDTTNGERLRTFEGHTDWIRSVAFAPDGKTLLSGGDDHKVMLWETTNGERLRTFEGHQGSVWSVAFAPDGKTLLSGGDDQKVMLWERTNGERLRTFEGHTDWIRSVAFAPDGKTLLSGGNDHKVMLWEATNGERLRTFEGHQSRVWSVAFAPDGKTLLSGGQDGQILRWSINSGQVVGVYRVFRDGWVSATASGAIHWGENGLRHLRFVDPDQHAIIPTRWHAEDLLPNGLLPEGTRLV